MKKIVMLISLGFTLLTAHAADWQPFATSDTGEVKLDQASIQEVKGIREAWSMFNFKVARENKGEPDFPLFKSYQDLTQYNCKAKTMRLSREILFTETNGTGNQRDHSSALKNMTFNPPAKDSFAEAMMNFVCAFPITDKK